MTAFHVGSSTRLGWIPAMLGLVLLGACGALGDGPGEPPPEIVALDPGVSDTWATTSSYQRELLRDGLLTYAEYERAATATVECIQENGFELRQAMTYNYATQRFEYTVTLGSQGAGSDLVDECEAEHRRYLDELWQKLNADPFKRRLEAVEAMRACLEGAGFTAVPQLDTEAFLAWARSQGSSTELADCAAGVFAEFGYSISH